MKRNYPEAVAYISAAIRGGARDGRTVAEMMDFGRTLLTRNDVMDGVLEMIPDVHGGSHLPGPHQARHRARADRLNMATVKLIKRAVRTTWA